MEDEAARDPIDTYWLGIPNGPAYLITKATWPHLAYKTEEDLNKLLALSNLDNVIVKGIFNSKTDEKQKREMTLEEACKVFGSRVIAEHWNAKEEFNPNETPKIIDLLTKKVI